MEMEVVCSDCDAFTPLFMTPSSNSGTPVYRPIPRPKVLPPLDLSYLTPARPHAKESSPAPEEHMDIIGELYRSGVPNVAKTILAYLSPVELLRCLSVCVAWHHFISQDDALTKRIEVYKKLHSSKRRPSLYVPLVRQPLASVQQVSKRASISPLLPPSPHIKLRNCPNCTSPAKELNLRRAECTSLRCRYDFCTRCLKPWHEIKCPGIDASGSSSKLKRPLIAGSAESKKRLRRL